MLLFKPKPKADEILPPPPPLPSGELEEPQLEKRLEKPSFFRGILKPEETKPEMSEEYQAFNNLLMDLDKEFEAKNIGTSIESQKPDKKLSKKGLKELKKAKLEDKKALIKSKKSKADAEFEDFTEGFDFALPKELGQEAELPDLRLSNPKELKQPIEILEAQEEIKSAIEKIKAKETQKPSIFQRFFTKRVQEQKKEYSMQELPETDDFSKIKNSISRARQALMNFDLESAKKNYAEALKLYNNLKPEEQAKIYDELKELYFERKSAEELKV